jgi:hypothetical protein
VALPSAATVICASTRPLSGTSIPGATFISGSDTSRGGTIAGTACAETTAVSCSSAHDNAPRERANPALAPSSLLTSHLMRRARSSTTGSIGIPNLIHHRTVEARDLIASRPRANLPDVSITNARSFRSPWPRSGPEAFARR